MVGQQETINLFKSKAVTEKFVDAGVQLKRMSFFALVALIGTGALVGMLYVAVRTTYENRVSEKERLSQTLRQYNTREGLFLSVKERVGVVKKVDATRKPWVQILDATARVVTPPSLQAIVQDTEDRMALNIKVASLEETVAMAQTVLALHDENRIKSPQLISLTINKDGVIQFGFSFIPVF